jgi:Acetyltransferase (GNAT) domain
LNALQPAQPEAKEPAAFSADHPLVEPATTQPSLQTRVVDPLRDPAWDHLVVLHRDASCFHTSGWATVLHQTYRHRPFYLQLFRGRRLAALVPVMEVRSVFTGRRGVCLPFSDACEPLIFESNVAGAIRDRLLHFAQARRWKHLEIRGGKSLQLAPGAARKFYGHVLHLSSEPAQIFGRFASSVRRAIRKAERSGVSAMARRTLEAVGDFYRLHVQTRRRHGLPPQPASFFQNIYNEIINPGLGFTVIAERRSRPVAAAIFLQFGKNALYKYGASDERFQAFRANNLVMWEGIQFLACHGAEKLDFGRTECDNDGLRRFKLSWGAEEETIDYFRVDPSGRKCFVPAPSDSSFHKKIFGRLPLAFNRLAGSMIYPHLD